MGFERIVDRFRKRAFRREYRSMVKQWYDDGGDYRFRFDYPLDRSSLALDLGGYEGQWASDLYSRHRCRILIFEPVRSFADRVGERFRNNDDIEVFQYGLGAASRSETIHVCGASSSTYRKRSKIEEIKIIDAKQWFDEHHIDSVQLMKINIEGGEYELLEQLLIALGLIEWRERVHGAELPKRDRQHLRRGV